MNLPYEYGPRHELATLLPQSVGRVLDIGCGAGHFLEICRARGALETVGIELHPDAAEAARGRADRVLCGDVETMALPFEPGYFNTIVCADVLEHLTDPWKAAGCLASLLAPGGCLIASIPNVAHYSVLLNLLIGRWPYAEAGLLDRTHLRFFTINETYPMLTEAGLAVDEIAVLFRPPEDVHKVSEASGEAVRSAIKTLFHAFMPEFDTARLDALDTRMFLVYQYFLRAVKR